MSSDFADATRWMAVTNVLGTLVSIASSTVLVWVSATVVRRHRPDAYRPLLAWSIAALVITLATRALYVLLPALLGGAAEQYMKAVAIMHLGTTALEVVLLYLLVRGIVAIAQPPKAVKVESDAPYR